ncbi:Fe3+-citrate ABC transporter substrate-binding protein [Vibrio fluvialis]|uniref:Fe3+-citrate ABC transporter substrate-binding protein n=1 Tax=Vibrio fluvialis TaxID=676 RepID=UPI0023A9FA14|nr:Fe3+-citrate ABC transporter substrate-binding protein [Vibrio fluvialis]MDE5179163.1 Fe3+-citrate ABC transporter substrate-binding protein [Vibrio fluvialis]
MRKSNLVTNTGHRFVTRTSLAYTIHIHTPDDSWLFRSVGLVKAGEKQALRQAIRLRNELGLSLWGKHWKRVLHEPELFTRLPRSLEPKIVHKLRPSQSDANRVYRYYIARWSEFDVGGHQTIRSALANIDKMGERAAYNKAKRELLEAHKDSIDIMLFMGRLNLDDLRLKGC